jgi:hypothetical protein
MARKKAGTTTTKKVEADEPIAQTAITKRGRTLGLHRMAPSSTTPRQFYRRTWLAYTPTCSGLLLPLPWVSECGTYPALCLGAITIHSRRVPRAPLPGLGVTLAWASLKGHLGGRCPSFIAPTGSRASPCAS